jgi:ribosomal protein S18 acetylase RimI-like enzyme
MKPHAKKTPPRVTLRPVAPPDEGFLLHLYATTRADELARSGLDTAQRDAFLRGQYQARRTHYALHYPGAEHCVIIAEGHDAGSWMVHRTPTEILLVNIELLPEHRSQGLGTALLGNLIAEAKIACLPLCLSVHEENRAAIRLYRRLGFDPCGNENGYLKMRYKSQAC